MNKEQYHLPLYVAITLPLDQLAGLYQIDFPEIFLALLKARERRNH